MVALTFLGNLAIGLIPAALLGANSVRLARRSREEWKLLAWVPVVPLAAWAVYVSWDMANDPTSHNLLPFELVFWAGLSLILLLAFVVGRRLANGTRKV